MLSLTSMLPGRVVNQHKKCTLANQMIIEEDPKQDQHAPQVCPEILKRNSKLDDRNIFGAVLFVSPFLWVVDPSLVWLGRGSRFRV